MKLSLLYAIVVLLSLIVSSCGRTSQDEIRAESYRFDRVYRSGDVRQAEAALVSRQAKLEEWQRQGMPGIDYDRALALVHARLFALYQLTRRMSEAEKSFIAATNYLARVARKEGRTEETYSREELLRVIERGDAQLELAWKTNLSAGSERHAP